MEIGNPDELCEKYDIDSKKSLIGPPYYSTYKFVLKIVLTCVALGMTISFAVINITSPTVWYEGVASWFSMLWSGLISGFAFVTAIFAIFYHKDIKISEPFNLSNLPSVPSKKQQLSKKESAFKIGMLILFLVVFIVYPQIFGVMVDSQTRIIPFFNIDVIQNSWHIILIFKQWGLFVKL